MEKNDCKCFTKNVFESSNLSLTEQKFRFLYKFLQNKHQEMFATGFKSACK